MTCSGETGLAEELLDGEVGHRAHMYSGRMEGGVAPNPATLVPARSHGIRATLEFCFRSFDLSVLSFYVRLIEALVSPMALLGLLASCILHPASPLRAI